MKTIEQRTGRGQSTHKEADEASCQSETSSRQTMNNNCLVWKHSNCFLFRRRSSHSESATMALAVDFPSIQPQDDHMMSVIRIVCAPRYFSFPRPPRVPNVSSRRRQQRSSLVLWLLTSAMAFVPYDTLYVHVQSLTCKTLL